MLNRYAIAAMVATMVAGPIHAQQTTTREPMPVQSRAQVLTTLPASATTITNSTKSDTDRDAFTDHWQTVPWSRRRETNKQEGRLDRN